MEAKHNLLVQEGQGSSPWELFGEEAGAFLGLKLRATAHVSLLSPDVRAFVFDQFCLLARTCFAVSPTLDELEACFHKSELIAVGLDGYRLVGISMGAACKLPGTGCSCLFVSGTFTDRCVRRLGLGSRLTHAISALEYPEEFGSVWGMWGKSLHFVMRTQALSAYGVFRKWFAGVPAVGTRPEPVMQTSVDAVCAHFGWALDSGNIQRGAYSRRLVSKLIPTLGERDALVVAGRYTWPLHLLVWFGYAVVYPLRHFLHGLRPAHPPASPGG